MKAKISKAQLEVWDWKEKAYQQVKDLSIKEATEFMLKQTKAIADELDRNKKQKK